MGDLGGGVLAPVIGNLTGLLDQINNGTISDVGQLTNITAVLNAVPGIIGCTTSLLMEVIDEVAGGLVASLGSLVGGLVGLLADFIGELL